MEQPNLMGQKNEGKRVYSRRDILRMVPLMVAIGVSLSAISGKLLGGRGSTTSFPKGSIFRPAKDRLKNS